VSELPRTSHILHVLADPDGAPQVSVHDIRGQFGERAFALFVVILGLPNCVPMVPPIPLVSGILLAFVALQMAFGRSAPWLPGAVLARRIARVDLIKAIAKAMPWVLKLERFSRPRYTWLETALAVRLLGFALVVMACALLVAAPLVGQIPIGLGICMVGLGLVERDGLVVTVGLVIGSLGVLLSLSFVTAVLVGLAHVF
jgi:hypothetical protein